MSGTNRVRRWSTADAFSIMRNDPQGVDSTRSEFMRMLDDTRQREARLVDFANALPRLTESQLAALGQSDSTCPICLTSLRALMAEEETAIAMDSPAHPIEQLGVTRLSETCGHIFCRKDIREWLFQGKTTCPTCRRPFIDFPQEQLDEATGRATEMLATFLWSPEMASQVMESIRPRLAMILGEEPPSPEEARGPSTQAVHNPQSEAEDGDDRNEFSSMYS
ncbi:hypothetical protein GY45DRAFT_1267407 [Cubamyces sp. BRFM 1775]|nr:hypothetical protein GY45DRAFT_1267407 [Cubamyces sp. BRFM 1775]